MTFECLRDRLVNLPPFYVTCSQKVLRLIAGFGAVGFEPIRFYSAITAGPINTTKFSGAREVFPLSQLTDQFLKSVTATGSKIVDLREIDH